MQSQAYEGYFDKGKFYTAGQSISIPERQRVYITILDEPIIVNENMEILQELKLEDKDLRIKWLEELNTAIELSMNENLPDITRSNIMREPIGLSD